MANHSSSKKAIRKIATRTEVNKSRVSRIRTFIKKTMAAIINGTKEEAQANFVRTQSELFKGVNRGVIKMNTASRTISRINSKIKAKA